MTNPIATTTTTLTGNRDLARRLPLFDVCVVISIAALLCAIVFREPGLVALVAPFVIAPAAALALWHPFDGAVRLGFESIRIVEGDDVVVLVDISSPSGIGRIELELYPSERLEALGTMRAVTSVPASGTTRLTFRVNASEWGLASISKMTIRVADRFGMFGGAAEMRSEHSLTIGLPEDRVAASLEAERFRSIVGSHPSTDRGRGLEIADVRPFQPGDSAKAINWRISNRRQEPWVTLRHPDRSTTVVVIVDAHDDDKGLTQRRSVGAALALSRGHLALHDRVGLLVVGHTLRWLPPKLGRNHLHQIADQLVAVSNAPEASLRMYRPPAISAIPNNAIVVAVSPLRDPLMVALVAEIRSRGNPVSVLLPDADEGPRIVSRLRTPGQIDGLARRLAAVEERIGIQSLRERGVAVVPWRDEAVVTIIESTQRLRNSMARTRSW